MRARAQVAHLQNARPEENVRDEARPVFLRSCPNLPVQAVLPVILPSLPVKEVQGHCVVLAANNEVPLGMDRDGRTKKVMDEPFAVDTNSTTGEGSAGRQTRKLNAFFCCGCMENGENWERKREKGKGRLGQGQRVETA